MGLQNEIKNWQQYEGRQAFEEMGITEGSQVIDFGCGPGRYSLALSYAVGDSGQVFAFDTSGFRLREVEDEAHRQKRLNIEAVQSDGTGRLSFAKDGSVDAVLIYDLIHQIGSIRGTFLKDAFRVLKEDGILSVLPFHMSQWSVRKLSEEIETYGFELTQTCPDVGVHFEMHEFLRGDRGHLDDMERGTVYNFRKQQK